ncbi:MAG: hypothetical protein MR867_04230, partial [Eubacterium sp.]|nr:hypothetical protein [Eubacterium sp.]
SCNIIGVGNHGARRLTLCNFGGANPSDKRAVPMYVTYTNLIQIGIFIVGLLSLCYKIFREKRK